MWVQAPIPSACTDTEKTETVKRIAKKAILNANGVPVLAHPCCVYVFNLDNFVKKLIGYGLMGIETYYPYKRHRGIIKFHSRKEVIKIAEKYNLIKTGGTDEHNNILDSIYDYTIVESDGAIKIN